MEKTVQGRRPLSWTLKRGLDYHSRTISISHLHMVGITDAQTYFTAESCTIVGFLLSIEVF